MADALGAASPTPENIKRIDHDHHLYGRRLAGDKRGCSLCRLQIQRSGAVMSNGVDFKKLSLDLREQLNRVTAEREALQLMLNDREEQLASLEQRRHAEQQACQAAERRVDELEGLLLEWRNGFGHLGGIATVLRDKTIAALNPTAEAASHESN